MRKQDIEDYAERLLRGDELKLSQATLNDLRSCAKEDLIQYHNSLGRAIRNAFGLWQKPWKVKLNDRGEDISKDHPDEVSMRIIEAAWAKL